MDEEKCPLCEREGASVVTTTQVLHVECPRCGKYGLPIHVHVPSDLGDDRHLLSGMTRDLKERKQAPPILDYGTLADLRALAPTSVQGRAGTLLRALGRSSGRPSQAVRLTPAEDYPLAFAQDADELDFYIEHLAERKLISTLPTMSEWTDCTVTADGWTAIEQQQKPNRESDKAFVALWFNPEMDGPYEQGIEPAIKECGYRSIRVDQQEFLGDIVDRIRAEIRESRFVVADVTGQRNGVYFEGDYAMGLGLPVVWLCREDEVPKLHFDTRQLNHIAWKHPDQLKQKLALRIRATIGTRGQHSP